MFLHLVVLWLLGRAVDLRFQHRLVRYLLPCCWCDLLRRSALPLLPGANLLAHAAVLLMLMAVVLARMMLMDLIAIARAALAAHMIVHPVTTDPMGTVASPS